MRDYDRELAIKKLHALGISPKRSLGQNFLIGRSVIEKIIDHMKGLSPKSLVEVGPGLGALTEPLMEMSTSLMVIELDRVFAEMWRKKGLKVSEGDALRVNWKSFQLQDATLISNLPYQISSSLVVDRSVNPYGIQNMVLMFQKEVAQRIMASPKTKEYGLLTVIAQACWDIRMLLEVGPNEFYPSPNVASRVLSFQRKAEIQGDLLKFLNLVKTGFAQRRKLLLSNLKPIYAATNSRREQWEVLLISLGYTPGVRAEEISVQDWWALYNRFFDSGKG